MIKFIHAADIHLDSPLTGLGRYEGMDVVRMREAPRKAFENLVRLAIEEKVDFVLLAGDLYDGNWPDYNTPLFFLNQVARLREAKIEVYLISGNHDAANKNTNQLQLPANVHLFSHRQPESHRHPRVDVVIHGQSFATAAVREDLSANYPPAVPGSLNIGLLHSTVDGREGHDNYAPSSLSLLKTKGYDYWALGHIHQREILSDRPFIAYPGNIQGRSIRETGAKGCFLVQVDRNREVQAEFRELDSIRWARVRVDASDLEDLDELLERVRQELIHCSQQDNQLTWATRIELCGETSLHDRLQSEEEDWIAKTRAVANDVSAGRGNLWIEKIKIETKAKIFPDELRDHESLAGLISLFKELKNASDPQQLLSLDLSLLEKKIPQELKQEWGFDMAVEVSAALSRAESVLRHELGYASSNQEFRNQRPVDAEEPIVKKRRAKQG